MKKIVLLLLTIFWAFVLLNVYLLAKFDIIDIIYYESSDGGFTDFCSISKKYQAKSMQARFEQYKLKNGLGEEVQLYRLTPKDYTKIHKWPSYWQDDEWQYPYMDKKAKDFVFSEAPFY
ncbi:MAG: hypothetical protein AAF798_19900 [Bacteroidota bacterium]